MHPKRIRQLRKELAAIPSERYRKRHLFVLRTKLADLLEVFELMSTGLYHTTDCNIDKQVIENFSANFLCGLPKPLPPAATT